MPICEIYKPNKKEKFRFIELFKFKTHPVGADDHIGPAVKGCALAIPFGEFVLRCAGRAAERSGFSNMYACRGQAYIDSMVIGPYNDLLDKSAFTVFYKILSR